MKEYKFETAAEFDTAMSEFATDFFEAVKSTVINHKVYGSGIPKALTLHTYNNAINAIVSVAFPEQDVRFPLSAFFEGFLTAPDDEISEVITQYAEVYKNLVEHRDELRRAESDAARAAVKKAEADKKAEANYQKQKEQAVKSFDRMVQETGTTKSDVDEFYYALGWLASHTGALTAVLPDYLGSAFEKHFGADAPKTLIDGRAKTSGGYAKQWSWEFKCNIKKLKETVVPACLQSVTADFSKGIHNTAFLWDLVSNYGFQFGKTQDVNKIRETIPAKYISSFETGLVA